MDTTTASERDYDLTTKLLTDLLRQRPTFRHDHPPILNVNQEIENRLTLGQRLADFVANAMGSWRFIIVQSCLIVGWVTLNVIGLLKRWDPYPFILLNLCMSFQAAYSAPVIMMSQNRQSAKDRLAAEQDYQCNLKAEVEIKAILTHLEYQDELILQVLHRMEHAGLGLPPRDGAPPTPAGAASPVG